MQIYTAVDIAPMGDMHPDFGQTYYGGVEEQANPVRFNLKQVVDIYPGQQFVAGEVEHRHSKGSGKPYTQLKKVKLSEPNERTRAHAESKLPDEIFDPIAADQLHPASLAQGIEPEEDWNPETDSLAEEWKKKSVQPEQIPEIVTPPSEATPSYEAGTNARWALKLSTDTFKSVLGRVPEDGQDFEMIEDFSKRLLGAFERLKAYKPGDEDAGD